MATPITSEAFGQLLAEQKNNAEQIRQNQEMLDAYATNLDYLNMNIQRVQSDLDKNNDSILKTEKRWTQIDANNQCLKVLAGALFIGVIITVGALLIRRFCI